jgi:hypothetical protein
MHYVLNLHSKGFLTWSLLETRDVEKERKSNSEEIIYIHLRLYEFSGP